jgi:hypothetical protein
MDTIENLQSGLYNLIRLGQISDLSRRVVNSSVVTCSVATGIAGGGDASICHDSFIDSVQSVSGAGNPGNDPAQMPSLIQNTANSLPSSYSEADPNLDPPSSLLPDPGEFSSFDETRQGGMTP